MSARLDLARLRRTQRRPLDEVMLDGTPASQVLMPRVLRMPAEGDGMEGAALASPAVVDLASQPDGSYAPAPEVLAPLRRAISFAPPAMEMPSETLAPIPPEALAVRRRFTPPEFKGTGDESADLARYGQSLSEWRNPADRNGRLKSFGLGALRGLMRGLATGQGLGAGIGGAVAGGLHGGIQPNADEREWRDAEIGRTQQRQGVLQERRLGALKLRGMEADVAKTEAEARKLSNPPPPKPDYQLRDGDDGVYAVNMNDPAAPPVKLPFNLKGTADSYDIYDDGAKVWAVNKRNPRDRYSLDDVATKPRPQLVTRTLADGTVVQVPATAALSAETQTEAANITAGNQYGNQSYEDTVKRQEREHGQTVSQWETAEREQARLVKALDDLNDALAEQDAAAQAGDEASRIAWARKAEARKGTVGAIARSLTEAHGNFVENDERGWPTRLKPRPAAPALPSRPAPQRRSVSAAPRSGGAVRNATPSSVMSVIERLRNRR